MYDYLCSCLPIGQQLVRNGVNRILHYLNNNSMNQQILEEEKCVEEYEQRRASADRLEKDTPSKHYQSLDKEEQDHSEEHPHDDEQPEITEPDPSSMPREQYLLRLVKLQLAAFRKHLIQDPEEEGFQRLVSDDRLKIFYNQRLTAESKRLSQYRFEYVLPVPLENYIELYGSGTLMAANTNLSHSEVLERINDSTEIHYEQYKKVLVVSPRDFLYLRHQELTAQREYIVVATSMKDERLKPAQPPQFVRGSIILAGTVASKFSNHETKIKSYLEVDLDLTVNPQMIKQPAMREIRKYVEKLVELCKRSYPESEPQPQESPKETYPNDSPLTTSIEGI